jgi:hypothetical protein
MGKDPGSGMNISDDVSESLEKFFGVKILKFFYADADPDPESEIFLTLDPSRMEKNSDP